MSYQTLWECRELDKLAAELGFRVDSSYDDKVGLFCRIYPPEEDPQGIAVTPFSKWEINSEGYPIKEGSVTEILNFLMGIQFMQNYVNDKLGLKKRVASIQEKRFRKQQHKATMEALLNEEED